MAREIFNSSDTNQIESAGLSVEEVNKQLNLFHKGTPFAQLVRPATLGDGIISISPDQVARLTAKFETAQQEGRIMKFVPASGAATRMFQPLYQEMRRQPQRDENPSADATYFFSHLSEFAFYDELKLGMHLREPSLQAGPPNWPQQEILAFLLGEDGMAYGQKPKGLLSFHKSPSGPRTPVEEHFEEALAYGLSQDGIARLHFTISPEYLGDFQRLVDATNHMLDGTGAQLDVSFSVQKPSTNTIAAKPNNSPFRDPNGQLVFRPGGHGSLIENLSELGGDLIILKNIDNVVPPDRIGPTIQYKKLLGGLLLDIQHRIFKYLDMLENGILPPRSEIFNFLNKQLGLGTALNQRFNDQQLIDYLRDILDRPIRVCGMVRNQGEQGGGPFWLRASDGSERLAIVETTQINQSNLEQKAILKQATHFNPVDLVCGVRDPEGASYPLAKFVDPDTFFISTKSQFAKPLLALERPGLWNGAMANWSTVFVEVPLVTFNPVKTVNDLLRAEHLSSE